MRSNNTIGLLPFLRIHKVWSQLTSEATLLDTERRDLVKKSNKHDELQQSIASLEKQYADIMQAIMQIRYELHAAHEAMNFNQLMKVQNQKVAVIYGDEQTFFEKDPALIEKINRYSHGAYATLFYPALSSDDESQSPSTVKRCL